MRAQTYNRLVTDADLLKQLTVAMKTAGSLRKLARKIGCSPSYLSDVLAKRRRVGPLLLDYLGVRQTYERVK